MRALIVGGSGTLGRALAEALAARGYDLRLHARRTGPALDEQAEALRRHGVAVEVVTADLREPGAGQAIAAGLDALDVLVLAAGVYHRAPLEQTTDAAIDEVVDVHVRGPLRVLRDAVGALRAARGHAIVLTDVAAAQPWHDHAAYASSRAAQAHLVRCLALELAPEVRVNAVAPGLVSAVDLPPEKVASLAARIPQGRRPTAGEVVDAVLMLLDSPASVTGQSVAVDGGRSLGRRPGT